MLLFNFEPNNLTKFYLLSPPPPAGLFVTAATTVSMVSSLPLRHPMLCSCSSLKSSSRSSVRSPSPSVVLERVVVQDTSLMVLRVLDSWEAVGLCPLVMGV